MKRLTFVFFILLFGLSSSVAQASLDSLKTTMELANIEIDLSEIEMLENGLEDTAICFKYRCYLDTRVGSWDGSGSTIRRAARKTLRRCRRDLSGSQERRYCRTRRMYCECTFGF